MRCVIVSSRTAVVVSGGSGGWCSVEGGEVDCVAVYFSIVQVGMDFLCVGGGDVISCAPNCGGFGVGWFMVTLLSLLLEAGIYYKIRLIRDGEFLKSPNRI